MEVLLCERVNDLRHSLFHLFNCLITTASELTGRKVWTIGRMRNCLDAHLGQIVCDKDEVVDWCIILVEMPLTRFEECWPLATESLPEHSNPKLKIILKELVKGKNPISIPKGRCMASRSEISKGRYCKVE